MLHARPVAPRLAVLALLFFALLAPAAGSGFRALAQGKPPVAAVSAPVLVSAPSPFVPGCEGAAPNARHYPNSVLETSLAIDPTNPQHLVAAWQQDRFSNVGSSGLGSAVSRDGGRTWTESLAPFTRCQGGNAQNGGDYERASDPWVTFAANGDVYQMALVFDQAGTPNETTAMLVSKSTDGGTAWSDPVTLIHDASAQAANDKNAITADPKDPNLVYAVWNRVIAAPGETASTEEETPNTPEEEDQPAPGAFGPAVFSRTTDGGATWDTPRVIYSPPAGQQTIGNIIGVLPNGDLVDVFTRIALDPSNIERQNVAVIRSTDKGETWSDPTIISPMVVAYVSDPYTSQPIRAGDILPTFAVDPSSGRLYVAWGDGRFSDSKHADIALSMSTDEGLTWSAPIRVNTTPVDEPAFVPTLAVMADGIVGLSYYDLRNNTPTQDAILTDHWLLDCHAACSDAENWNETHIAGPFDMQRAPYARGFFIGDYQGLVSAGNTFMLVFAATNPPDDSRYSDDYFATVALPGGP